MNTRRDPLETILLWTSFVAGAFAMMCLSVISPEAYIWTMAIVACLGGLGATFAIAGSMADDGPVGFVLSWDIVRGGFQVVGVILLAVLDVRE